jgi:hypothetical protein
MVSVALCIMSVMLLAACRASLVLPILLRSSPYSVIVHWKRVQSALCQALLGGDVGSVWLM